MLNEKALGLSGGILWGAVMLVTTWASVLWGYGTAFLGVMADVYPGFSVSWGGSIVGAVYGFIDGFIGLYLLAWIYNKFEK